MKTLIVDIETRPNKNLEELFNSGIKADSRLKDPEKIQASIDKQKKESIKKMSVDTDFSEVFCVGIHDLEKEESFVWDLKKFIEMLNTLEGNNTPYKIVTFNGQGFDIPVLLKQAIKQGLKLPMVLREGQSRYTPKHIDLMQVLGTYWKYKSLDMYLQIYLGIAKKEIDFENCSDQELRDHCLEDIENTAKLFNLFKEIC